MRIPQEPSRLLVVGLTTALLLTGFWAATTSVPAFGTYNPGWQGASELRAQATAADSETIVATNVTDYNRVSAPDTIAVILSPERRYSDPEAARIRQFVQEGGTLVIAEDFGPHTNSLLIRIGARVRVDGRPIRDEQRFYRDPNISVATGVTDANVTTGVGQLTLNHGTALDPNGARVLVETSPFAYLDTNRNMSLEQSEPMRRHPVVTSESVGDGRVIAISDPSIFINAMMDRSGNEQFAQQLVSERPTVLLDYSHTSAVPPLAQATLFLRQSPALRGLLGLGLIGVLVFVSARLPMIRAYRQNPADRVPPPSRAELRERISRRHPDWDEERITRVIEGIMTRAEKGSEDD